MKGHVFDDFKKTAEKEKKQKKLELKNLFLHSENIWQTRESRIKLYRLIC